MSMEGFVSSQQQQQQLLFQQQQQQQQQQFQRASQQSPFQQQPQQQSQRQRQLLQPMSHHQDLPLHIQRPPSQPSRLQQKQYSKTNSKPLVKREQRLLSTTMFPENDPDMDEKELQRKRDRKKMISSTPALEKEREAAIMQMENESMDDVEMEDSESIGEDQEVSSRRKTLSTDAASILTSPPLYNKLPPATNLVGGVESQFQQDHRSGVTSPFEQSFKLMPLSPTGSPSKSPEPDHNIRTNFFRQSIRNEIDEIHRTTSPSQQDNQPLLPSIREVLPSHFADDQLHVPAAAQRRTSLPTAPQHRGQQQQQQQQQQQPTTSRRTFCQTKSSEHLLPS